nr:bile acid:sodium symporter [Halovulum dunhuangense]
MLDIGLPLGLFGIMFWLGLELRLGDFRRVLARPRALVLGLCLQGLALPALGLALILSWPVPLPAELGLGVMLLAASPGGVTSNLFTRLAGGDTALSITLTATMTLAAFVTVPTILALAQAVLGLEIAGDLSFPVLSLTLFALVVVPVALGVLARVRLAHLVARHGRRVLRMAALLLGGLLALSLVDARAELEGALRDAGLLALALNLSAMALALIAARMARLEPPQARALSLECGLQSTPTALTLAVLLGLPAMALTPAAFYGIWMLLSASAFAALNARRRALHP